MSDMQVQAELTLKDNMTKPAAKGLEEVAKSADKLQQSGKQRGADGRFLKQMAADGTEAARSMDAVGRETQQLQQQLKSAERSGSALRRTLSGVRDAGRDAAKHMAQMSKGLAIAGRNVQAAGGGVMAAGYVAKRAIEKPASFEAQSLDTANTIYADSSEAEIIAKAGELRSRAYTAARDYGGTSGQAMEIINGLGAGGMSGEQINKLLPVAQKTMVAGKLSAADVTSMIVKGVKNKMFTVDNASLAMDEGLKSGQLGGFEFKDSSRWMPQIAATGTGMKSHEGYKMHLANLQGVETVSANADQAGNNYLNLLAKMTAPDVKKNFKSKGINLEKVQLQAAAKGIDPITAMADAIDTLMAKNKKYQSLKKSMAAAGNDEEKRQIANQMADIMEGGQLGKLIPDRQAMVGLIGITSQKEYIKTIRDKMENAEGTVNKAHTVVASGTDYKMQQVANESDAAMSATLDNIKTPLDATLDRATRFAQDNPALATVTAGTAVASAGGGLAGTAAKVASKAALPLAMGGAAYEIYRTENDASTSREQKNISNMQTYGGFGGMLTGAAMGGAAGSVVPILGNGIGAILGGLVGYFAGGQAGKGVGEMAWGANNEITPETVPQLPDANIQQDINLTVELDGQKVAEILERRQSRESLRQ